MSTLVQKIGHVVIPHDLLDQPIFIRSREDRVEPFLANLAKAYRCRLKKDAEGYRIELLPPLRPMLSLLGEEVGKHLPAPNWEELLKRYDYLRTADPTGTVHTEEVFRLQQRISSGLEPVLREVCQVTHPIFGKLLVFSSHPGDSELPLDSHLANALQHDLEMALVERTKFYSVAKKLSRVMEDFSGDSLVSPDKEGGRTELVVEVNTEQIPPTAKARLVDESGLVVIEGDLTLKTTAKTFELSASSRPPKKSQAPNNVPEPLAWAIGSDDFMTPEIDDQDLYIRLPDKYFVERQLPRSTERKAVLAEIQSDPYLEVDREKDAIFVIPNGSYRDVNEGRKLFDLNVAAWRDVKTVAQLLERVNALALPWNINPERIVAPQYSPQFAGFLEKNSEVLTVIAAANKGSLSQLTADEISNLCWAVTLAAEPAVYGDTLDQYELPRLAKYQVNRVLSALALKGAESKFDWQDVEEYHVAQSAELNGISFSPPYSLKTFAYRRKAYGKDWADWSASLRVGHYIVARHVTVKIGVPHQIGYVVSLTIPTSDQPFDMVTLSGLSEAQKDLIESTAATLDVPTPKTKPY